MTRAHNLVLTLILFISRTLTLTPNRSTSDTVGHTELRDHNSPTNLLKPATHIDSDVYDKTNPGQLNDTTIQQSLSESVEISSNVSNANATPTTVRQSMKSAWDTATDDSSRVNSDRKKLTVTAFPQSLDSPQNSTNPTEVSIQSTTYNRTLPSPFQSFKKPLNSSLPSVSSSHANSTSTISPTKISSNFTSTSLAFNVSTITEFNDPVISSAWQCWYSSAYYSTYSLAYVDYNANTYTTVQTGFEIVTLSSNPAATSFYTLCDGIPRVDAPQYVTTLLITTSTFVAIGPGSSFTYPTPTCTIPSQECAVLSSMSISLHDDLDDYMRDLQPCQQFDSGCEIEGGVVQLLYWQPEKIVGDLCDTECVNSNANATSSSSFPWDEGYNSTGLCAACSGKRTVVMTSADADIVTAVYDGHTLTSPTVYYSFDSLWTVRGDVWIGTETLYNQVVPVDPAEVSTFACNAYGGYGGPSEPMNWADLASPAPANVYCCIATGPGDRPTIYGDFNPTLAFPSQVKGLDPEWSTCGLFVGISDPPYALTGTSVAASPEDPFTTTQGEIRTGFLQPTPNSWRPPPGPSAIMRPPTISPTALSATYPAKSNSPQTLDSGPTGAAIGGDSSHRWNSPSSAVEFPPPQEQGHTKIGGFKSQQHPLADSSNQSPSFVLDISGIIESDPGRHQSMDSDVRLPEGNSMQGANSPVYMSQDSVSQYHGESGRSPGNIIVKMFGLQAGNADPHDGAGSGNGDGAQAWQGKPSRLPFDPPSSHLGSSQTGEEIEMAIDSSGIADNPSENTDSHGHSHDGSAATDPSSDAAAEDTTHQNSNEGGTGAGEMASMAPDPASYNKPSSDFQSDWSGSLGTSSEDNTGAEPVESGQKVTQAILAIDGKFVTAFEVMDPFGNPEMVLGGRTLALGTTLVTGGTTISAAASGIVEEAEGKTSLVPWQTRPPQISEAVITLEGKRVTATEEFGPSGSAKIVLDGSTFLVGQTFSKGDALINAGASGITEIVGGKTSIIPWQAAGLEFTEVVLSLNGLPITAVQQRDAFGRTEVVIGGQTLHFGDVVTIDGTTLSIESSAIVEIDTKKATTIPWQVADPTTAHSLTPGPTDDSVSTKSLQTASAPSHVVRKAFGLSCIFTSILLLSI